MLKCPMGFRFSDAISKIQYIPRSRQNPKFVVCDDPEAVGHLVSEGFPFFGQGFSKEL